MNKMDLSTLLMGIILGMVISSLSNYLGKQRYSDSIKACIIEKGPNK